MPDRASQTAHCGPHAHSAAEVALEQILDPDEAINDNDSKRASTRMLHSII